MPYLFALQGGDRTQMILRSLRKETALKSQIKAMWGHIAKIWGAIAKVGHKRNKHMGSKRNPGSKRNHRIICTTQLEI